MPSSSLRPASRADSADLTARVGRVGATRPDGHAPPRPGEKGHLPPRPGRTATFRPDPAGRPPSGPTRPDGHLLTRPGRAATFRRAARLDGENYVGFACQCAGRRIALSEALITDGSVLGQRISRPD
jgi:hypothetical protein